MYEIKGIATGSHYCVRLWWIVWERNSLCVSGCLAEATRLPQLVAIIPRLVACVQLSSAPFLAPPLVPPPATTRCKFLKASSSLHPAFPTNEGNHPSDGNCEHRNTDPEVPNAGTPTAMPALPPQTRQKPPLLPTRTRPPEPLSLSPTSCLPPYST